MSKMMEHNRYHAQIEYDAEDELFIGKVYGITDSLNFHGTSAFELEEMFHQSVDNYLAMCAEVGKHRIKNARAPSMSGYRPNCTERYPCRPCKMESR